MKEMCFYLSLNRANRTLIVSISWQGGRRHHRR
jgi:hypothetical protein